MPQGWCVTRVVLGVSIVMCSGCASRALLETDFSADPIGAGWLYEPAKGQDTRPAWTTEGGTSFITAVPGARWLSPACPCRPFQYYRVAFRSKADEPGHWATFYYDADGAILTADDYSLVDASTGWAECTSVARALERAATMRVAFLGNYQTRRGQLHIRRVTIEPVSADQARQWLDDLYQTLPPLAYTPDPARWRLIPKTIERLRTGEPIRIVMLGHSLTNDTCNSKYELLLSRLYPKARIAMIPSVRGSTGCAYYHEDPNFKTYVADCRPDLLMVAANGPIEAIRTVIAKAKQQCRCEILLITNPFMPNWLEPPQNDLATLSRKPVDRNRYVEQLKTFAAAEHVEFLDLMTPTHDYFAACARPAAWFHRDGIHANHRGEQIFGRVLERYFAPRR